MVFDCHLCAIHRPQGLGVTIFKPGILFLFGNSTFREIIHLRVSAYKHEFKAFERTQQSRETLVTMESRIIPNSWSAPKLMKKKKEKKDPIERVTFSSQVGCSVFFCN